MKIAALVIGMALVVVSTGTAATLITSRMIKNYTIQAQDMAIGSANSRVIQDGSVGAAEIRDGSVGSADLAPGVIPAASSIYRTDTTALSIPPTPPWPPNPNNDDPGYDPYGVWLRDCNAGDLPVAAGFHTVRLEDGRYVTNEYDSGLLILHESYPVYADEQLVQPPGYGWRMIFENQGRNSILIRPYVVCWSAGG